MSTDYALRPVPGIKRFLEVCKTHGYTPEYKAKGANKGYFPMGNGKNWIWVALSAGKHPRVVGLTRFGRNDATIIFEIATGMNLRCRCLDDQSWVDIERALIWAPITREEFDGKRWTKQKRERLAVFAKQVRAQLKALDKAREAA